MNDLDNLKARQAQARADAAYQHEQRPHQPRAGQPHRPRNNPLLVPCTWCRAGKGQPCTLPGRTVRMKKTLYHPSRVAASRRFSGTTNNPQ